MNISEEGLKFIARWEKFEPKAYPDSGGIWTIGFGTTHYLDGTAVRKGDVITLEIALTNQCLECDGIGSKLGKLISPLLKVNQFDSLISLCYNIGTGAFRTSTILKELNSGKPIKEEYFTRWNKIHRDGKLVAVNGLTRRRRAEFKLFNEGIYGSP